MPMVFCPPPFFSTQVLLRISPPLPSPSFYLFLATEHHFLRSSSRSYKRLIFRCKHKKKRQEEDLSSDDLHLSTDGKSSRQRSLKQQIKRRALLSYRNRFTQALQAELVSLSISTEYIYIYIYSLVWLYFFVSFCIFLCLYLRLKSCKKLKEGWSNGLTKSWNLKAWLCSIYPYERKGVCSGKAYSNSLISLNVKNMR